MNETPADATTAAARLSALLRDRTADAHRAAERSPFMTALLRGEVDRAAYATFLARLEPVYAALEAGLRDHAGHPVVGRIVFRQVERRGALGADLAYFGAAPAAAEALPAAAQAYVGRLRALAASRPELLVAHAYTRYLGDLSGGQVVARQLRRAFGLSGPEGLAFYDFPEIPDLDAFKHAYRSALDSLPLQVADAAAIVDEACRAFAFNRDLADEVWDGMGGAAG